MNKVDDYTTVLVGGGQELFKGKTKVPRDSPDSYVAKTRVAPNCCIK